MDALRLFTLQDSPSVGWIRRGHGRLTDFRALDAPHPPFRHHRPAARPHRPGHPAHRERWRSHQGLLLAGTPALLDTARPPAAAVLSALPAPASRARADRRARRGPGAFLPSIPHLSPGAVAASIGRPRLAGALRLRRHRLAVFGRIPAGDPALGPVALLALSRRGHHLDPEVSDSCRCRDPVGLPARRVETEPRQWSAKGTNTRKALHLPIRIPFPGSEGTNLHNKADAPFGSSARSTGPFWFSPSSWRPSRRRSWRSSGSDFCTTKAQLQGACLDAANLAGAVLSDAKLGPWETRGKGVAPESAYQKCGTRPGITSLRKTDLTGAQLQRADLSRAWMHDAILSGAQLPFADSIPSAWTLEQKIRSSSPPRERAFESRWDRFDGNLPDRAVASGAPTMFPMVCVGGEAPALASLADTTE